MENEILHGSVIVEASDVTDMSHFAYRPRGWELALPLMNVSAMVSDIAPVVLLLRYRLHAGDLLIIEEPEAHMHPAMQVEFMRLIAAMVKSGLKVIVTTHSEWILEELANLTRLSSVPEKERSVSDDRYALDRSQVGAFLFKPGQPGEGSQVEQIDPDDDSGLYPTGFDDVALQLHNRWADISDKLEQ